MEWLLILAQLNYLQRREERAYYRLLWPLEEFPEPWITNTKKE